MALGLRDRSNIEASRKPRQWLLWVRRIIRLISSNSASLMWWREVETASWVVAGPSHNTVDTVHTEGPVLFPTIKLSKSIAK